jgi:hypothetical protein
MAPLATEWLTAIGKSVRILHEDMTHKSLPHRWVDLIHHLNEQERALRRQPGEAAPVETGQSEKIDSGGPPNGNRA